ncbi:hypothetical protein JCM14036_22880 [Desulfotomaculum defluvii]
MGKKLLIALFIMFVLIIMWSTRLDYLASKNYNTGVTKWKIDRWTGQVWIEEYKNNFVDERPPLNNIEESLAKKSDFKNKLVNKLDFPYIPGERVNEYLNRYSQNQNGSYVYVQNTAIAIMEDEIKIWLWKERKMYTRIWLSLLTGTILNIFYCLLLLHKNNTKGTMRFT